MWVTKLLISPVKKRIFCPKTTKFGPKLAFLVNLGQAMQAYSVPCWWVVWWLWRAGCISQDTYLLYFYWLLSWFLPFSTCPQIYIKNESNFQIFYSETIVSLENGGKEANMHMPLWKQCKHSKHCKQYKQCQHFIGIYGIFFLSTDQMFSKSLNSRKNEHSYSGLITLHVSLITQSKSKWKSIRNQDYWPS